MFENLVQEVRDFLPTVSPTSKIYLGCDSQRHKRSDGLWYATYTVVAVVHRDNRHGCKCFASHTTERDYDTKKGNPSYRLMNEVYKVTELYTLLAPYLEEREVEIHLDINPNVKYGSSCVVSQAIGYVRGVSGQDPVIKPASWAASHCADHAVRHPDEFTTVVA